MKRRDFIKNSAITAAAISAAPAILKSKPVFKTEKNDKLLGIDSDKIMIILEMFGGNDGINTIIPYSQEDTYMDLRPTLNIPKDIAVRFQSSDIYMNPALVTDVHNGGMMRLLENGQLAIIEGIGYNDPNLSHFRSRDIWQSGINSSDPNVRLLEGWLGRYFAEQLTEYPEVIPEHPIAVQIGGTISMILKSAKGHMGIALNDPDVFYELGEGLTPEDSKFTAPVNNKYEKEYNFVHVIAEQSDKYSQAVKEAYDKGVQLRANQSNVNYSEGLPEKFRVISSLIAGGLKSNVYFVRLANFDSHAQQMNADYTGAHPTLLNQAAKAISEFLDDAGQLGFADKVAGMTISEFGRRAYDNGSRGSDHGAASMQFVFAGNDENVNGGYLRETGKPDLEDLDPLGNIKHQYDFRRTYVDFLERWFGTEPSLTETVFGEKLAPIEVLPVISSVGDELGFIGKEKISV
ncbi:MAG: DUF1501 domain-containing protein, partial [Bacteroidota bacterium]